MPVPFIPNISVLMPEASFDALLAKLGVRLTWRKAHTCPCIQGGAMPGAGDPSCLTCQGRGIYWDAPSAAFTGLLTWRHMSPTPDEFGAVPNEVVGLVQHGEPALTIPYTADANGTIWNNASVYDAYVQIDATARFEAVLNVGGIQALPYQQGLTVASSGAVTVYDSVNRQVSTVVGYTVSGAAVTLPSGYAPGTAYNVEFFANPVFVAIRKAGAFPMTRPFGGADHQHLPRRFRIQSLDLWTRASRFPGDASPQGL